MIKKSGLESEGQVDLTDEILASQVPAPSREAVACAEALLRRPHRFRGKDRFAAAVACALLGRSGGMSVPDVGAGLKNLNQDICEPVLDPSELRDAIYVAFFEPEIADQIIADALSVATNAEPTAQPNDVSPPGGIVEATAPSSLTVAAVVDAAPPDPAVTTAPECPLCAARRKAKRERTRRWRARMRNATQLSNAGVANV